MRLLTYDHNGQLHTTRDLIDDIPPYAILSHTWGADEEEVTYNELRLDPSTKKVGYRKIDFCGRRAQEDGLQHFWVDTCCINKANQVELSEAITSMFRWYQNTSVCYVYLTDVSSTPKSSGPDQDRPVDRHWVSSFRKSRWFTRGWTLQELLAPQEVLFFSKEKECLGSKSHLEDLLCEITSIPRMALCGQALSQFSVEEQLRWAKGRATKREEDQAYYLLGI